jgi:hypothetical protein
MNIRKNLEKFLVLSLTTAIFGGAIFVILFCSYHIYLINTKDNITVNPVSLNKYVESVKEIDIMVKNIQKKLNEVK